MPVSKVLAGVAGRRHPPSAPRRFSTPPACHAVLTCVMFTLALLSACNPCPTWDELELVNADGATAEAVEEARAAIDEFAAWSGREGVCVSEVRLEDEVVNEDGEALGGRYDLSGSVHVRMDGDITRIVRHELCHAVDHLEGWVSESHPELFGTDDPTEALADLCDDGPGDLTLAAALTARCDTDYDAALRFIDETVYPLAEVDDVAPTGSLAIALERRIVEGLPSDWDWAPVAAGGALWAFGKADADRSPLALRVDPDLGVATPIALPEGFDDGLFADSADGVLLVRRDGTAAWRWDGAGWVDTPFPALPGVDDVAVIGDEAWVVADEALHRVDLATGTSETLELPDAVRRFELDGDSLLALAYEDGDRYWLRFSPATGEWAREEDPHGWRALDRMTLADGRELAVWDAYAVSQYDVAGVAVRDGTDWWLADDPCGDDTLGLTTELLSLDGDPWLWEFPNGWLEGEYAGEHTLTRVEVP